MIKNIFDTISYWTNLFFNMISVGIENSKCIPIICVMIIYLLSVIFTAPTRHGADRFYVLALNIIEHHSINIQKLVEDRNHYALISVDLFNFNNGRYINMHPGQALWGLPGLSIYRLIRQINNFSNGVSINHRANDKIDFILGTYAMNITSSALLTAITAMFFIYLAEKVFPIQKMKLFKISVFILLFYLATPLFYYSTHIIQNQSESSLTFIALGSLCICITLKSKLGRYYFMTGFVIGLAFLTNFSSLLLLPFGILHILLNGFTALNFGGSNTLFPSLRTEIGFDLKRKTQHMAWLCLGFLLPALILLYYQYLIFDTTARSIHGYLFEMNKVFSPGLAEYVLAFLKDLLQNLFSSSTGLFSYSPILFYPAVFMIFSRFQPAEQNDKDLGPSNLVLRQVLFRTMLLIQPLFILFYTTFQAKNSAEMGWPLSIYNVYSARYLLPIVFPLGYIIFDLILRINGYRTVVQWFLWVIVIALFVFSIITNVTATILGDWIFSVSQVWHHFLSSLHSGPLSFIMHSRQLVDW